MHKPKEEFLAFSFYEISLNHQSSNSCEKGIVPLYIVWDLMLGKNENKL